MAAVQQQPKKSPSLLKRLTKLQNPFMKWLLQSPLHIFVSRFYMLITFTGRKSGKVYTTPVQYARQDNKVYVTTSKQYIWWRNLRGGADVQLRIRGKDYPAHADINSDPATVMATTKIIYPSISQAMAEKFSQTTLAIHITLQDEV